MPAYWTGTAYRWKQTATEYQRLAWRLKRAYWFGPYGRAWQLVEVFAWLVAAVGAGVLVGAVLS